MRGVKLRRERRAVGDARSPERVRASYCLSKFIYATFLMDSNKTTKEPLLGGVSAGGAVAKIEEDVAVEADVAVIGAEENEITELLSATGPDGLDTEEANARLLEFGYNE